MKDIVQCEGNLVFQIIFDGSKLNQHVFCFLLLSFPMIMFSPPSFAFHSQHPASHFRDNSFFIISAVPHVWQFLKWRMVCLNEASHEHRRNELLLCCESDKKYKFKKRRKACLVALIGQLHLAVITFFIILAATERADKTEEAKSLFSSYQSETHREQQQKEFTHMGAVVTAEQQMCFTKSLYSVTGLF